MAPDLWQYRAILTKPQGATLATVTGTTKVVGTLEKRGNGGVVVHLPEFYGAVDGEYVYDEDMPTIDDEHVTDDEKATSTALLDWLADRTVEQQTLPVWAQSLTLHEDVPRRTRIAELEASISQMAGEISEMQRDQAELDQWRHLFTASGEVLERQVANAFEALGFEVLESPQGRRDLRIRYGEEFAVVEVKGLSKSAAEANAAQLEKWTAEAMIEYSTRHKGVLVANTWRALPLSDRNVAFPHQMLAYAESRDHCLITGLQLFLMVSAVRRDPGARETIARQILDTVGSMPDWDDLAATFESVATDDRVRDSDSG